MKLYIIQTKVTRMVVTVTDNLEKAQAMLVSNLAINPAYVGHSKRWIDYAHFQADLKRCDDVEVFLNAHRKKCGLEILSHDVELNARMPIKETKKLQRALYEVEGRVTEHGVFDTPPCFQIIAAAMRHFTSLARRYERMDVPT